MMLATDETGNGPSPLVRAMANVALAVLGRIVVRAPVAEPDSEHREQAMHELIARCGIKLRAPFSLLARERRPKVPPLSLSFHESSGTAPFGRPADGPQQRA